MGWTQRSANIGFLVIDRNGNSQIGDGSELFSNISPQNGVMAQRNGFRALAVYDQPSHGGNKDGIIDSRDPIYSKLRVWVDKNHNGHSEPDELMTFDQAGIKSISVHYKPNHWKDAYGNEFRYSSTIRFVNGRSMEIYDVFLVSIPNSKNAAN